MSAEAVSVDRFVPAVIEVVATFAPQGSIDVCTVDVFDAWLPRLGPGSTLIWHYLARTATSQPTSATVAIDDLAEWTGLKGYNVRQSIDRLIRFGRAQWVNHGVLAVEALTTRPKPRVVEQTAVPA